ncbi:MAG: hypothetical protein KBA61_17505 [Spirochaetes bacterium]|jgi:hypothetical protein|nr:hypothetical protein [Spirochaetota bacterium]
MKKVPSKNNAIIRLEKERWIHIVESHNEVAGMMDIILEAVNSPDKIFEGWDGELLALKMIDKNKGLVVVYRETGANDGFVITAFLTKRLQSLEKRRIIWQKQRQYKGK